MVLQDIAIGINKAASNLIINLPNSDIRRLELEENQIRLSDGTLLTYAGENIVEFDLHIFELHNEHEIITVLKDYEPSAICLPANLENGWVCLCGHFNKTSDAACNSCGKNKDKTFDICSEAGIKRAVEDYKEKQDALKKVKEDSESAEKEKLVNRYVWGIFGAILLIIGMFVLSNVAENSRRRIYSDNYEMEVDLQGMWDCYIDGKEDTHLGMEIDRDVLTTYTDDIEYIITWNSSNGSFNTDEGTYIVNC